MAGCWAAIVQVVFTFALLVMVLLALDAAMVFLLLRGARLAVHAKKAAQMFASVPALLFMIYLGIGIVDVLDSTLARMHLPGGTSAGASTIASPLSLASRGAASDAIGQWNQWSDRYTRATFGESPGTGLPVGVVLLLYLVTDVFFIALPVFLIIRRINWRATERLKRFEEKKNTDAANADQSAKQKAVDALSRVSGLEDLLRMSAYSAIAFFALDVLGDASLVFAGTSQNGLILMATGLLSFFKWLALASALIGLVVGLIGSREMRRDPYEGIKHNVERAGNRWAYLLALRIQIGVGVFLLLFGVLPGDLGHQLDDAFLFPFGRGGDIAISTGVVAGILFVTSLITANLCLRAYLPRTARTTSVSAGESVYKAVEPKHTTGSKIRGSIVSGLVLLGIAAAAYCLKWPAGIALIAPGLLLILVGLYSIPAQGQQTKPDVFNTNFYANYKIGWPYSIGASVIPLVVLTALAVRNGVRLLTIHEYGYGWLLILAFPAGAIVLGLVLGGLTYWILHHFGRIDDRKRKRRDRRDGRPARWSAVAAGILAAVLLVAMASSPQQSGGLLGPWGVVFALCIFLTLAGTALVMLSDQIRAWGVVAAAGFRRTPFVVALLICFMVNSAIDNGYAYHDVRLGTDLSDRDYVGLLGSSPRPDFQIDLKRALDEWAKVQRRGDPQGKEVPLVFVASAGGGIRAAYWTALVMRCLVAGDGKACPNAVLPMNSIFLASGISGGSLGLAGIHGVPNSSDWLKALQQDFLGPTIAAMAFRDLPNAFLRLNIHDSDRAAALERAWENATGGEGAGLDRGLVETAYNHADGNIAFPLLLLNGTSVTDGCRVAATALDLSTITPADGQKPSSATDCLALNEKRFAEHDPALPTLPATKDVFDNTCAGNSTVPHDIRLSTAALLSARFPYVSPTGGLHSCRGGGRTFDLDGGLIDSSGALPLAMIWPEIVSWISSQDDTVCFAPKLIIMENSYLEQTKSNPPAHPSELAAPLSASVATQEAAAPTARQAAALAFQKSFAKTSCGANRQSDSAGWTVPSVVDFYPVAQPGIQAPLGWTLSRYSQESLESEMGSARNRCAADIVAAWFSGSTTETQACRDA